jgi:Ca2+/H+ antiporter
MADSENRDANAVNHTFVSTLKPMALTGPLNLLLLCTPVAMISYYAEWPSTVTFIFSLIALAPLAERLGFVTEQLAMHTNDTVGGLLNATFGNATELIVAITALKRGLFKLVQLSLLGSILSNLLLVLGTSLFCGGLRHSLQHFGTISSQMNSTLLMLATMGILFPTILSNTYQESNLGELGYSRATALILFLLYFAFLYFQVPNRSIRTTSLHALWLTPPPVCHVDVLPPTLVRRPASDQGRSRKAVICRRADGGPLRPQCRRWSTGCP